MDNPSENIEEPPDEVPVVYGDNNRYLAPFGWLAGPMLLVGLIFSILFFVLMFFSEASQKKFFVILGEHEQLASLLMEAAFASLFCGGALLSYIWGYTHCQNINEIPDELDDLNRRRNRLHPATPPEDFEAGPATMQEGSDAPVAATVVGPCNYARPATILWVGIIGALLGSLLEVINYLLYNPSDKGSIPIILTIGVIANLAIYLVGIPGILYGYAYQRCLAINGIDDDTNRLNTEQNKLAIKVEREDVSQSA